MLIKPRIGRNTLSNTTRITRIKSKQQLNDIEKKLQEKTKMISALKQEIKENFQNYLLTVIDMFKAYKALQTNTFNEESTNIKDETTRLLTVLKEQRKN